MTASLDPRAAVLDLLARPASAASLGKWAVDHGLSAEQAFDRAYSLTMALLTAEPALALRAAKRLRRALGRRADPSQIARAERLRAHALRVTGRIGDAAEAYEAAFALSRERRNALEAARTGIGWVQTLAVLGEIDEAAALARRIRPALLRHDPPAAARLDTNLANAHLHVGATGPARALYEKAHRTLSKAERPVEAAHAAFGLARLHLRTGRPGPARAWLQRSADALARGPHVVLEAYVEATRAALDLAEGSSEVALRELDDLRSRLDQLQDRRSALELELHTARLLGALGSPAAALRAAQDAIESARALESSLDVGRAALLAARASAGRSAEVDTAHYLSLASRRTPSERPLWRGRIELERARIELRAGDLEAATARLRRLQPLLDRRDRRDAGATARMLQAEIALAHGHGGRARKLLIRARRDARSSSLQLARPHMALLIARADELRGDGGSAVRWATRAVEELERELVAWHASPLRRAGAESRDQVHGGAVEIVLRHGGRGAVERAADLVARARSPRLVEDLLRRIPSGERERTRRALARLRRVELEGDDDFDPSTRAGEATSVAGVAPLLDPEGPRSPAVVRRAWKMRRLESWRARLGPAEMVLFHRGTSGWHAFCVRARGGVRHVELPGVDRALAKTWRPLRLLLETAARMPRDRRETFLERTRDEAEASMRALRAAIWEPLGIESSRVFLVPDEALYDLPLEALALDAEGHVVASRLPHPALLRRPSTRRRPAALLLHGPGEGQRREVRSLRGALSRAGFDVQVGSECAALEGLDQPVGAVHLAAHGVFRRGDGRLSGLRLDDGWLGFEHLPTRGVRGSLLVFSSCESGLTARRPGRDAESWLAAGFGLGAREMVLTLWKIDDAGSQAFSGEFYPEWTQGLTAAASVARAAAAARARGEHPYRWAAHFAAG